MPRGRVRCTYVTDSGQAFWVWVDRDSLADANRGWVLSPSGTQTALARQFLPRRVIGVDAEGHTRYSRIATVNAPLWTGAVSSWSYEGTDRLLHQATVVGRQAERDAQG